MVYCDKCMVTNGYLESEDKMYTNCDICGSMSYCNSFMVILPEDPPIDPHNPPDFDAMAEKFEKRRQAREALDIQMRKEHAKLVGILVRYQTFFEDVRQNLGFNVIRIDDEELHNEAHELLIEITSRS